jgi:hypothetical protein
MLVQTSDSKPHTVYIMQKLAETFPNVIYKIGGYNDRSVRGKPHIKSLHASGRAIDIYLEASIPVERKLGELLYQMFKNNADTLKVNHVIFNWKEWSPGGGMDDTTISKGDSRGPHTNHVHVDFVDEGMKDKPVAIVHLLEQAAAQLRMAGFKDWMDGKYGPAYHPDHHADRLSQEERQALYDLNTDHVSMNLSRDYLRARKAMQKVHANLQAE